ncbi:MAG: hypothetical protein ACRDU8_06210, partial [Egibacteraceae bacterium]
MRSAERDGNDEELRSWWGSDMAKTKTLYRCTACGHAEPRWVGRCSQCAQWGSMVDQAGEPAAVGGAGRLAAVA